MSDPVEALEGKTATLPALSLLILIEDIEARREHGADAHEDGCPICEAVRHARDALSNV